MPEQLTVLTLIAFWLSAGFLWTSTFGYWWYLESWLYSRKSGSMTGDVDLPPLTIVIPVLNEEAYMRQKLDELANLEYPAYLLNIVVADGGSTDATPEIVENYPSNGLKVRLLRVPGAAGKFAQVTAALAESPTDLVVFSDVDTTMDRRCIQRLVSELQASDKLAIAGCSVVPVSNLEEEKFHWRLVNRLWHLEGERFGLAGLSGVCLALRRSLLPDDPVLKHSAEDMELANRAIELGGFTRVIPDAIAFEHRVPQNLKQMLEFRKRRAGGYRDALLDSDTESGTSALKHPVNRLRAIQFAVNPVLMAAFALLSGVMLSQGLWIPVLIASCLFMVSLLRWLAAINGYFPGAKELRVFLVWLSVVLACLASIQLPRSAPGTVPVRSIKSSSGELAK